MGIPQATKRYTPLEYYRLEEEADYKSNFYAGEIFAMAGGTIRHSRICTNLVGELRNRLKGSPCSPYESNLRLRIQSTSLRCYPDVSVFCDNFEFDPEDPSRQTVTNPTVLFEVLSKSTEAYDRGLKSLAYRTISSLKMYVLILQDEPRAEIHRRQPDGKWVIEDIQGLDTTLPLTALNVNLPMAEVYYGVDFDAADSAKSPSAS